MNDEKLKSLEAELERQNALLAEFESTLRALGDVELAVPHAFLDELDELSAPRVHNPNPTPFFGVRG